MRKLRRVEAVVIGDPVKGKNPPVKQRTMATVSVNTLPEQPYQVMQFDQPLTLGVGDQLVIIDHPYG